MGCGRSLPEQAKSMTAAVIGGGYAGAAVASKLAKSGMQVSLFDKRDALFHAMAGARSAVWPGFADAAAFLPYDKLLPAPNGRVVRAEVIKISEGEASRHVVHYKRADGAVESQGFDFVALCTGSRQKGPAKPDSADKASGIETFAKIADAVKGAGRVAVVGGGAVGVELSFEIKAAYPGKQVVLVHSGPRLFSDKANNHPDKNMENFAGVALARLEKEGIEVRMGRRGVPDQEQAQEVAQGVLRAAGKGEALTLRLENGSGAAKGAASESIEVDLVINARGAAPLVGPAADSDWEGLKQAASRGGIAITKQGMVASAADPRKPLSSRLFAVGDCAMLEGMTRTAYQAKEAAPILAGNIEAVATALAELPEGHEERTSLGVPSAAGPRLKDLKVLEPHAMIPIGHTTGVGMVPGGSQPPEFIIGWLKAGDLMTAWTAGDLNTPAPKLPGPPTGEYAKAPAEGREDGAAAVGGAASVSS